VMLAPLVDTTLLWAMALLVLILMEMDQ